MLTDVKTMAPAVLVLADGTVFKGKAAGKIGTATGEICFNTGMTGYQEVFTDPSYYGQLMVMTNVHIGNYGIKHSEVESDSIKIAGLIVRNFTDQYSRLQADSSIQAYLESNGLVGITDVDTRALVRHIRSKGAMNGIISSEELDVKKLRDLLAGVPDMDGLELASQVCTPEAYYYGDGASAFKVAVLDFGIKKNILRCFDNRDVYCKVFPAKTTAAEIKAWNPDGFFLSNGPGDPAAMPYAIETTQALLQEDKPLFGICLGHQILAQAMGISTYKMHHGHRGINHPVKNLMINHCEITSQNHGFCVDPEAVQARSGEVEVTHMNLNDHTVEGIRLLKHKAFSVQYHPEAAPGPHDSRYLFDQFVQMMAREKAVVRAAAAR